MKPRTLAMLSRYGILRLTNFACTLDISGQASFRAGGAEPKRQQWPSGTLGMCQEPLSGECRSDATSRPGVIGLVGWPPPLHSPERGARRNLQEAWTACVGSNGSSAL